MQASNSPIAYDFHGDTPFSVPFPHIRPEDIHVYLDLDTKVGKNTCGQKCTHCWFVNYEKVYDKSFTMEEGPRIKAALEAQGYRIYPRYVDSFAYDGAFMRLYGPANNREFRQESDHRPTQTMERGDAWTSGRPLLGDNYAQLLDLARECGYGTISITYHGLIDEDLTVADHAAYPIKGVFSGRETEEVVRRITAYNRSQNAEDAAHGHGTQDERFRINIGVTVGRHNNSREALERYVRYFNRLGVDTVRFNNFADHGGRHPDLPLGDEEVEQVYRDLKWLHENVPMDFQLAVSEDFGTVGIKAMGFPAHVGWCRAGRQLFAVIPTEEQVLLDSGGERYERIGAIVGCVNTFEPHLGELIRRTGGGAVTYLLEFDHQAIADFTGKRLAGVYKNGCFARELAEEQEMQLHVPARRRLALIETGS